MGRGAGGGGGAGSVTPGGPGGGPGGLGGPRNQGDQHTQLPQEGSAVTGVYSVAPLQLGVLSCPFLAQLCSLSCMK